MKKMEDKDCYKKNLAYKKFDWDIRGTSLDPNIKRNQLEEKMQSVGITAYRLAKLSGVSQATISRMKQGKNCTKNNWDAVWEVLNNQK
jgi:DNA-binding Xre family transcriptional regulator